MFLPLPPHLPSYVLQTRSARVRRRTRGQNRGQNLLAHNLTVLRTIGYHLLPGHGPWLRARKNLRRQSDDTNVPVRLATILLWYILIVNERGVCLFRYPLRKQPTVGIIYLTRLKISKHPNLTFSHMSIALPHSIVHIFIHCIGSLHIPYTPRVRKSLCPFLVVFAILVRFMHMRLQCAGENVDHCTFVA